MLAPQSERLQVEIFLVESNKGVTSPPESCPICWLLDRLVGFILFSLFRAEFKNIFSDISSYNRPDRNQNKTGLHFVPLVLTRLLRTVIFPKGYPFAVRKC